MQPRFVEMPELKVIGLGMNFVSVLAVNAGPNPIPELWHRFINRVEEIPNRKGCMWGLVEMLPKAARKSADEMFYIAAAEVGEITVVPQGMISRIIPAGRYALFTHRGPIGRLPETMHQIYRVWLPAAKEKLREGAHLELYDERFSVTSEKSELDILLPILG